MSSTDLTERGSPASAAREVTLHAASLRVGGHPRSDRDASDIAYPRGRPFLTPILLVLSPCDCLSTNKMGAFRESDRETSKGADGGASAKSPNHSNPTADSRCGSIPAAATSQSAPAPPPHLHQPRIRSRQYDLATHFSLGSQHILYLNWRSRNA